MQRHEMIAAMSGLGLKGMAGAFDEAVTTGIQRIDEHRISRECSFVHADSFFRYFKQANPAAKH